MEKTVSQLVRRYLCQNPTVRWCLDHGLINLSALGRTIATSSSLDHSAGIVSALRRSRKPAPPDKLNFVSDIFNRPLSCEISYNWQIVGFNEEAKEPGLPSLRDLHDFGDSILYWQQDTDKREQIVIRSHLRSRLASDDNTLRFFPVVVAKFGLSSGSRQRLAEISHIMNNLRREGIAPLALLLTSRSLTLILSEKSAKQLPTALKSAEM